MTAALRTRYAVHRGHSAYVLEYAPVPGSQPRCAGLQSAGDATDEQTTRDIASATPLTLHGGAPDCPGRWRITVFLAASTGNIHYPGQSWATPLDGASAPPKGSGDQIVGTRVVTIH